MDRIKRKDLEAEIIKINEALKNIPEFSEYEVTEYRSYERLFSIEITKKSTGGAKEHYSFDGVRNAFNYAKRLNKLLYSDRVIVKNFEDIKDVFYMAK